MTQAKPSETDQHPRRRWMIVALACLLGLPVLLFAGGFALLRSDAGQAWIKARIEAAASEPGGLTLAIGSLSGPLPGGVTLEQVALGDPEGSWLTADRITLEWRPLALLAGRLSIESLVAGTLTVARAPVLPEAAPSDEPFSLPELPVALTLERLEIERLVLGEALLGRPAALGVSGMAGAERESGATTRLLVTRLDGVAGRIDLTAGLDPAGEVLTLDLQAAEPPGGIVSGLLALPDLPEVALRVTGEGPLEAWRGELSGRVGTLADWQGTLALGVSEAATDLGLSAGLALRPEGDDPLAAVVAGDAALDLALRLTGDERLLIERVALENPTLALDASGSLRLGDLDSDLTARLALKRPEALAALAPDIDIEGLAVEARSKGPLLQPALQSKTRVEALALPGASLAGVTLDLAATAELPLTDPGAVLKLQGSGGIAALDVEGAAELQPLLSSGLRLDLDGVLDLGAGRAEIAALTLGAAAFELGARGDILLAEPRAKLDLDLALPDLGAFASLAGLPLAGSLQARTAVDAAPDEPEIALPFAVELADLGFGQPAAEALLGAAPRASGRLVVRADGGVSLERLAVEGAGLTANAQAEVPAGLAEVQATYALDLPNLGPLSEPIGGAWAGRIALTGTAAGALADPTLDATLEAESVAAAGLAVDRATARLRVETPATGPQGRLEAEVAATALPDEPLRLDTDFRQDGTTLTLDFLRLRAAGSEAGGSIALDLERGLAEGALEGEIGDLSPWLALAGQRGEGRGRLSLALSAPSGRQAAAAEVSLAALAITTGDGPAVGASAVSLRAESSDLAALAGEAEVTASDLRVDGLLVERLTLAGRGKAEALALTLSAETAGKTRFALDAEGRLAVGDEAIALSVSRFDGTALDQAFALQAPLEISRSGRRFAFRGLDLTVADGRLSGDAALDGERIEADLTVAALPLSIAREIAGLPGLDGRLAAQLNVEGRAPAPLGRGVLTVEGLETGALADAPPLRVALEADWRDGRLALEGEVAGFAEAPATLALDLPLRLDPDDLAPTLDQRAALSGRLAWSGPVERIWPLVPVADQTLSGAADLQAALSGSAAAPVAEGSLSLSGGRYENVAAGTLLTDLEMRVGLSEQRAVIERFSAADGGGGRIELEGSADLAPERGFPFALTATLEDFTAVRRDEVTGALGGSIGLSGSLEAADIAGALETRGVEIRIPSQLPPEIVELEVREVNRAAVGLPPVKPGSETAQATVVALDVSVSLPGQVFVRGSGLDSEWRGDLRVTGSADAPAVAGSLELVRGQLTVLAREFALTRGKIDFAGGPEIDPLLDIVAENRSDELTVALRLLGPASRPAFELSSQPPLPEDEVLARVLFGKATTELTAIEALQLAGAAAELSGEGSGAGPLDFARDLVGVDSLRLESAEGGTGAPALAAGKAITEDVYVGVKQGAAPGSGSAGVEIEVYPNVLLESGVGQGGSSNLGVKFKWDY